LEKNYTLEELATFRANASTRKYKSEKQEMKAAELNSILRRNFKDEFDNIVNVNEVINSKRRKASTKIAN